jgi:phosphohistidine phosphatase
MIVYFLRHANAGQRRANALRDEKRPLDKEGVEQARCIGRMLAALEIEIDTIVSSPLKRAMQTALLVANEIGHKKKVEPEAAMRPGAAMESFHALLERRQRDDTLMVVGHNPSISRFISLLLSEGENDEAVEMKKGAIAKVQLNGTRSGVLSWCVTPRIARTLYDAAKTSSTPRTSRK